MKLAVPDLISNSYFPAIVATELGFFKEEGLNVSLERISPVEKAYAALRDGAVDFVAGSAHSALAAFPDWVGVKLLCAQAQGMYWFLVMHADIGAQRGDLGCVKGRSIGAAPWVGMGLRQLLVEGGIDIVLDRVRIAPVPGAVGTTINFGLTVVQALADRKIDGFWANGMAAEVAVRRGIGTLVLDVRRGDGPPACFNYTMASLAATERFLAQDRSRSGAAVRAIAKTHRGSQGQHRAGDASRPSALSACRGGADHGAHPPRSAVLRHGDLTGVRRRHEPVRPRSRHPVPGRRLRAGRRLSDRVRSGSVTTVWMIAAVRNALSHGDEKI